MSKKKLKKRKKNKTKMTTQEKILLVIFIILVIVVITLGIQVLNLEKSKKENREVNIIIPIIEKQSTSGFKLDASSMKKGESQEYLFKITNYKGNKVNESKMVYNISLTPSENTTIELYKDEDKVDLIENENSLEIEGINLPKNTKSETVYKLIISKNNNVKTTDMISVKVDS